MGLPPHPTPDERSCAMSPEASEELELLKAIYGEEAVEERGEARRLTSQGGVWGPAGGPGGALLAACVEDGVRVRRFFFFGGGLGQELPSKYSFVHGVPRMWPFRANWGERAGPPLPRKKPERRGPKSKSGVRVGPQVLSASA